MGNRTKNGLMCLSWLTLAAANFWVTFIHQEYLLTGRVPNDADEAFTIGIIVGCVFFAAIRGYRWLMAEE